MCSECAIESANRDNTLNVCAFSRLVHCKFTAADLVSIAPSVALIRCVYASVYTVTEERLAECLGRNAMPKARALIVR